MTSYDASSLLSLVWWTVRSLIQKSRAYPVRTLSHDARQTSDVLRTVPRSRGQRQSVNEMEKQANHNHLLIEKERGRETSRSSSYRRFNDTSAIGGGGVFGEECERGKGGRGRQMKSLSSERAKEPSNVLARSKRPSLTYSVKAWVDSFRLEEHVFLTSRCLLPFLCDCGPLFMLVRRSQQ